MHQIKVQVIDPWVSKLSFVFGFVCLLASGKTLALWDSYLTASIDVDSTIPMILG